MNQPKIPERPIKSASSTSSSASSSSSFSSSSSSFQQHQNPFKSINNSINQPTNQSTNQPANQSTNQSINQSTNQIKDLFLESKNLKIDYFLVSYSTLNSDSRSCLVPSSSISNIQENGLQLTACMFYYMKGISQDITLFPDPSTLIQLPWKPNVAWITGNLYYEGKPFSQCPRQLLLRVIQKAKNMGISMKTGFEPEFSIITKNGGKLFDEYDYIQPMSLHDSSSLMRNFKLLDKIFKTILQLGWNPYQIDHEASSCQYEINYNYSDALQAADRYCFFKFMIKELAEIEGCRITFMPVPFDSLICANGLHINMSLWKKNSENESETGNETEINLFPANEGEFEISQLCRHFIGGMLKYANDYCAILCPTINSYKRLNRASWCPNTKSWGFMNKSVLIRMPNNKRIEHRLADSSSNPYLSQASLLAAGLQGITNRIDPGQDIKFEVYTRINEFERINNSLEEGLRKMEVSDWLKEWLGEGFIEGFVIMKNRELNCHRNHFCEWEKNYYLNC